MEARASRAQSLFYVGLFIVLATAILSAALPTDEKGLTIVLTTTGALVALAGRLWLSHIQRVSRRSDEPGAWATR